ncbi:peptidoglycan-binding domain-containing protein [Yoonia sp.]|uniref:peptidoglycan-binding domain-containing protein n=1 Tax=Yoonia sp. TaxID=2212373 RepID=UPI002FDB0948
MRNLLFSAALLSLATPVFSDDAAVLIGVERYDELRRVSSATDILDGADALRDAGYQVQTLSNGTAADIRRMLSRLSDEALEADRLVVALSGRFATDGDRTWFLGRDSDVPAPFDMDEAVSVDMILSVLSRTPGQSVLLLGYDQRNSGNFGSYLREGVGLSDVPQGVTVIYGEPNRIDDVIEGAIVVPRGDVIAFVRNDGRLNSLGFQPRSLIMQPERVAEIPVRPQIDPSLAAWNSARAANTADAYRDFIFAYPRSTFADQARQRLDQLENDPARLAEQAETALSLSRNDRRAIQSNLTLLGYDTRGVDGIFGRGSRTAIRNWQQDNGFAQTSFLDAVQINRLDAQASRRKAEIEAEEERARAETARLDRDYWEETGATGTDAGYRAYLQRYPNGIYADEAREALAEEDTSEAQAREDALNINSTLRRLIESRLASLGFNPGPIDGQFDGNTRRAIASYQSQRNLTSTGFMDQPTLARLLADTFGR